MVVETSMALTPASGPTPGARQALHRRHDDAASRRTRPSERRSAFPWRVRRSFKFGRRDEPLPVARLRCTSDEGRRGPSFTPCRKRPRARSEKALAVEDDGPPSRRSEARSHARRAASTAENTRRNAVGRQLRGLRRRSRRARPRAARRHTDFDAPCPAGWMLRVLLLPPSGSTRELADLEIGVPASDASNC